MAGYYAGCGEQVVTRSERWQVPAGCESAAVRRWPAVVAAVGGLTAAWLLTAPGLVGLVTFRGRTLPPDPADWSDPTKVAGASLAAIEVAPSPGATLAGPGWVKTFDRSSLVLTTWFPHPCGRAPLWPNSPPLPRPA